MQEKNDPISQKFAYRLHREIRSGTTSHTTIGHVAFSSKTDRHTSSARAYKPYIHKLSPTRTVHRQCLRSITVYYVSTKKGRCRSCWSADAGGIGAVLDPLGSKNSTDNSDTYLGHAVSFARDVCITHTIL